MNAEIYRAIRLRERMVKIFKLTRSNIDLIRMRQHRNRVNSLIETAKKNYICNTLRQNQKKTKKFWKLIKNMLDGSNPQAEPNHFEDPDTNRRVNVGEAANFLNDYFCNISTRLGFDIQAPLDEGFKIDVDEAYFGIDTEFCLISDPFVRDELEYCIDSIDISKSTSVLNISTFVCRDFMRAFPHHMLHIYNTSIRTGIFPSD